MKNKFHFLALVLGVCSFQVQAEQTIICPESTMQEGGRVIGDDIPDGFETLAQTSRVWLSGVSLYDGHPERNAVLKPREDTVDSALWRFDWSYPNGKWISCDYGTYGAILYQRLDDSVTECLATLEGTWKERNRKISTVCR